MKRYSAVAVFSQDLERVVLIHKLRPAWQAGKANFPGGKVEDRDCGKLVCAWCRGTGWVTPASELLAQKLCITCDGSGLSEKLDPASGYRRCAARELAEETGLVVDASSLTLFCTLRFRRAEDGEDAECRFYCCVADVDAARTMEDEEILLAYVRDVLSGEVLWYKPPVEANVDIRQFTLGEIDRMGGLMAFRSPTMPNLPWLVAMARQTLSGSNTDSVPPFTVTESSR